MSDISRQSLEARLDAYDHESITVSNSAVTLDLTKVQPATPARNAERVVIDIETDQIRYTYDGGTTPTSSVGHLAGPGDRIVMNGYGNIRRLKMIRVTADATIKVTYER